MRKVIVIGSPGAGKSTFSHRLQELTGIPLYHLDMIWHKPDRTTVSRDEFDSRLNEIFQKDSWIIDGNYMRTMEVRMKECDTVFFLDYPTDVCLLGASSRVGKKRDDMPWVETEFREDLKQWIKDFPKDQLPRIYELLEKYSDKNIVVFKSREEADNYLQSAKTDKGSSV